MANNQVWLASHLYYAEPWEKFLIQAVKPFSMGMLEKGLAEQFFFIRYWEKGPHIRLRFKGEERILNNEIKPQLKQYFEKYFEDNSSLREDIRWPKDTLEQDKWYPNNTIQFIQYDPEIERYGGDLGLLASEQQFHASSKAVLTIIEESINVWDYSRALGGAIQLHLGFGYALGMDLDEMTGFFNRFFDNWLSRAYYFFENDIAQEELEKRKEGTLIAFQQNYSNQKDILLPFFETVWQALNDGQKFEQEWMNIWVDDMTKVGIQLRQIQRGRKLTPASWYMRKTIDNFSIDQQERWSIYDSYVHMTNNRLGIKNRDEAYLAYLLIESAELVV